MRGNRFVDRGDPLPLGRVLGQPLEAASRPELAAFGFEILEIVIGHAGAYGRIGARWPVGRAAIIPRRCAARRVPWRHP